MMREKPLVPPAFEPYLSKPFPCRLCGRMIRMLRTENNKSMPVDAEAITLTEADMEEGLPVRLLDRMGRSRIHLEGETGLSTHFGTCPEYHGAMPPDGWAKGKAAKAPNPTRRSLSHMLDRLAYLKEAFTRIGRMHRQGRYDAKHIDAELNHLKRYIERTERIIEAEQ